MDEIQRKLALIDAQLTGGALRRRLVSTMPLFFPAVGLMAGIVVQDRLVHPFLRPDPSPSLWFWLSALGLVAGAAGIYSIRHRTDLRPEVLAYGTLLAFACLGALRLLVYEKADPRDIRHVVGADRILATVRGRIVTQPSQEKRDWGFAELVPADPSSAFYLRLDQLKSPTGWQPVVGTIRVQVDEPVPNLRIGDQIQAYCWLHRFEEPTNPGQFNLARYLQRRNVLVGASVPAREAIEVTKDAPGNLGLRLRRTLTEAAAQGLLNHPFAETQSEALLAALLLGQRYDIDRVTNEAFRRTGLLHLISLSGMHLSILIGLVWWLCRPAGFSKRTRALICIAATALFLLVVPPLGPILRAAVIVWAYCLSILLRRRSNALNSLALAALVLLLIQPTQLFDAGWQLSFACVAGILALTQRLEDFTHAQTRDWFRHTREETAPAVALLQKAGRGIISVLSVGTAAWLASAGILLYHFYNITPLASVWTALASPAVTVITTLGFVKIVLSFCLPTVSLLLGHILAAAAGFLIWQVKLMARLDFSYLQIGHVPLLLIAFYYGSILFVVFVHLRRPVLKRSLCTALVMLLVVPLGLMKWQRTHREYLSLTCLDVGHGQAILAQLPGTTNLLFDAGSLYNKDVGARIVLPCLDYLGLGRLDAVVASHHDVDHINGIPEVVGLRPVGRVYLGDMFFAPAPASETAALLTHHLATNGIRPEHVPETISAGPARVRLLWPAPGSRSREGLSENDQSLVYLIEFAGRRVLLCSDIEKPAQQEIMRLYPSLKADVVIAPHHGSARTSDGDFLRQLEPRLLVCSCGRTDFQQGRVLKKVDRAELLHTAQAGAITVRIDRTGEVQVRSMASRFVVCP
jgi:competence protein ComEC